MILACKSGTQRRRSRLHVSGDVAVLGPGGLVDVTLAGERAKDDRGDENVGQGHPVTDEEGRVLEDLVQGVQSLLQLGKDRDVRLEGQHGVSVPLYFKTHTRDLALPRTKLTGLA